MQNAMAEVDFKRKQHYADRHAELSRRDLLGAARAVEVVFRSNPEGTMPERHLTGVIRVALGKDAGEALPEARKALDALEALGYVWKDATTPRYRAGIPSRMDYVRDSARNASG